MQALVKKLDIYTHSRSLLNIDLSLLLMMTRNIGTFEENGLAIVEIVFSLLEKENESDFFRDFWPYRDHTDKRLLVYSFICSRVSP